MMPVEHEAFVAAFAAAWAARDPGAFDALWHADGVLVHPVLAGPVHQRDLATFQQRLTESVPDLTWRLDGWAGRDDRVFVEWTCIAMIGGRKTSWSGVDRFRLRDGKIVEEVVYSDTQPLWAAIDPSLARPALLAL